MAKKKIRVWGKIRLFEASAVGIAAYPDAHLSARDFSLCKALHHTQINKKEEEMAEEEQTTQEAPQETTEEPKETSETSEESSEETSEVSEKETTEESTETEKSISDDKLVSALTKAFKEAIKDLEPKRGLVSKEENVKDTISKMSTGELALSMFRNSFPQ